MQLSGKRHHYLQHQLQGMVPKGMCVHIGQGKARDQVLEVVGHFNMCVTEKDIFSRCQVRTLTLVALEILVENG